MPDIQVLIILNGMIKEIAKQNIILILKVLT